MKICMITPRMIPSEKGTFVGGHTNSAIRLSKALSDNHQVLIITGVPQNAFDRLQQIDFPWATIFPFQTNRKMSKPVYVIEHVFKSVCQCQQLKKTYDFDIIHGHSGHHFYGLALIISQRMLNVPAVHTLYCPLTGKDAVERHSFFSNQITSMISLRYLDKVIAISKNVAKSLESIGIHKKKIEVIPPIIDTELFHPNYSREQARQNLGLNQTDSIILFVGNLSKTKGIDVLLEAMLLVLKTNPAVKLIVTFDIALKDSTYETQRKKEIEEVFNSSILRGKVIQLGIVDDIIQLIAASDLLVAPFFSTLGPSDYPLPLLEAMAMGKAVVGTKIGGVPEIIEHEKNGMLIEPGDVTELARAIVHLLGNKGLRAEVGANAARFVSSNFSKDRIVAMHEQLYREIYERRFGQVAMEN